MINIISGENNQGKTARIRSIYASGNTGDGFITRKIFSGPEFCGYEIVRLSTGESRIQSLKSELFPPAELPLYKRGSFAFFKEGFAFADSIIDDILLKGACPVFIDEIGPLELHGKGHHDSLVKVLDSDRELYFTVRNWCLEKVISFYSLENYTLIRI